MSDHDAQGLLEQASELLNRARGCDKGRLLRNLKNQRKKGDTLDRDTAARLLSDVKKSAEEKSRRENQAIAYNYPAELPIVERRDEIVRTIRENQVVVLSGETGSGKTTQIPKMCLEAGRGTDGLIGCTQPRRIAALTVSARIAEELADESLVGSKIRFHDSSRDENLIRVLTDGMLLAEAQSHPTLRAYDTLIIDEAHERSLNIDVLLGMVRRLIDKRRDLKVIITSATLDTEKFSKHFGDAPIVEVSGRMYPVDIVYDEPDERTAGLSTAERCAGAVREIVSGSRSGDILVFLPTEQDIRETMELVSRDYSDRLDILPLFARLPASEQKKAFRTGGKRKLVAATNVAETSLTIPGIRYVVDSGLARISRYNPGTGTHGLPVDPISRASADQRAGRCGRVQDGVCIRLYSEEDYAARPRFTPPEIRRTNLAEVVLRLLDLGIGDIEAFPFVDPPASAGVRDGLRTLREIGALAGESPSEFPDTTHSTVGSESKTGGKNATYGGVKAGNKGGVNKIGHRNSIRRGKRDGGRALSPDGRLMARLPLDPRLAKVLLQADREGCLGDVLPIAAALSLPDPRERPPEKAGSADAAHRAFADGFSDFIVWLNIWDGFRTYRKKGSFSSKLKKYCAENYLSFRRMKEWMDVHRQLALVMEDNGYRPHRLEACPSTDKKGNFTARYSAIHRSLLSGFLSHIARKEEGGGYEATRNRRVLVHPGSCLRKANPPWIMAAEIVRTSKLFARSAAAIDPEWLIDLASGLASRNWIRPHWSRKAGAVMATEQLRLYGFLISDDAVVPYGAVRPDEAREIFIKSALVEGDLADGGSYGFLRKNARLIRDLESMQARLRRKDLVAGEDAVASFYDGKLPRDVLDLGTLNRYLKESGEEGLVMTEEDLLTGVDESGTLEKFPESAEIGGERWKISYVFDTDSPEDGATLRIPSGRLSELSAGTGDWLVPGMLEEKVEALMRGLPKKHRRRLIPIPETAAEALEGMERGEGDLIHALSSWLYRERGIDIPPAEWDPEAVPLHLRMRYSLLDDSGRQIASGRDPADLARSAPSSGEDGGLRSGDRIDRYRKENEREGLKEWPSGGIPESVEIQGGARLWPALRDEGDSVSLRFLDERDAAEREQMTGQERLARIHWAREIRDFRRSMPLSGQARVYAAYLGGARAIEDSLWDRIIRTLFATDVIRGEEEWKRRLGEGGKALHETAEEMLSSVSEVLGTYGEVRSALSDLAEGSHRKQFVDDRLADAEELAAGFVDRYDPEAWKALPRWLRAQLSRARKGSADPRKDAKASDAWVPLRDRYESLRESLSPMASPEKRRAVEDAGLMIQELRVALFAAGDVRAAGKVSEAKMKKALDGIERML